MSSSETKELRVAAMATYKNQSSPLNRQNEARKSTPIVSESKGAV
jgi:hypothetical protein